MSQAPRSGGGQGPRSLLSLPPLWDSANLLLTPFSLYPTLLVFRWLSTELWDQLRVAKPEVNYLSFPPAKYLCPLGSDITPSKSPSYVF